MNSKNILVKLFSNSANKINQRGGSNETGKFNDYLLIINILFITLLITFIYYNNNKKYIKIKIKKPENINNSNDINNSNNINDINNSNNLNNINDINNSNNIINSDNINNINDINDNIETLRIYDYNAYNNDLMPPRRRDDTFPAHLLNPDRFRLYTRGAPTFFRKFGYLTNENLDNKEPYKFLSLMGRQKYYNSTQYEYYVVSTNRDENIKFDLENYKRELYDGDKVIIPQLNNTEYIVNIDKNLEYDYSPYIL
jgi:hypothetical protein